MAELNSLENGDVKFGVGEVVITPAASAALAANGRSLRELLARHQAGDWGDVSDQTRTVNQRGLQEQFNVLSAYPIATGARITVVTNRDRTLTMVHLDPRAM